MTQGHSMAAIIFLTHELIIPNYSKLLFTLSNNKSKQNSYFSDRKDREETQIKQEIVFREDWIIIRGYSTEITS